MYAGSPARPGDYGCIPARLGLHPSTFEGEGTRPTPASLGEAYTVTRKGMGCVEQSLT